MSGTAKTTPAARPTPPAKYAMPHPPAVVVWRNCVGGESSYAIVTKHGRSAISVMVFPTDSRVGVPKDGVRHADDPMNKNMGNSDSGIWEYTAESLLLQRLASDSDFRNDDGK